MHVPATSDDRILHFILIGTGLGLGSFIKTFWDKLAEKFWDKEWEEFRKWKTSVKDKE
jgi:hypothetical protein